MEAIEYANKRFETEKQGLYRKLEVRTQRHESERSPQMSHR